MPERREQSVWTPQDEATFVRWRRGFLIFYGCAGLILLTMFGTLYLTHGGARGGTSVASTTAQPVAGASLPRRP
jgi:hypothetical protein